MKQSARSLHISEEEAYILKVLLERNKQAEEAVYAALQNKSLVAFNYTKREYEDSCMDVWSFNLDHGIRPIVEVKIPYV